MVNGSGRDQSWVDSGWWDVIGALAGVLSLLALAIAVYEFGRARRRVPGPYFGLGVIGRLPVDGRPAHVAQIFNAGTLPAYLISVWLYGGRFLYPGVDYLPTAVLGSGETAKMVLSAEKLSTAYIVIVYQAPDDYRRVAVTWLPLTREGEAATAWRAASTSTRLVRVKRRIVYQARRVFNSPARVGPGDRVATTFKSVPSKAETAWMLSLTMPGEEAPWPRAPWSVAKPDDLPFIGRKADVDSPSAPEV